MQLCAALCSSVHPLSAALDVASPTFSRSNRPTPPALLLLPLQELSLKAGDLIEGLSERKARNDGWWTGRRCGRVGLFPERHVERLPASTVPRVAISNAFYNAASTGELSYEQGELVEVICEPLLEPSVYIGRLRGEEGTVDVSCVEWINTDAVIEQLREPHQVQSAVDGGGVFPAESYPGFRDGYNSRDSSTSVELEGLIIQDTPASPVSPVAGTGAFGRPSAVPGTPPPEVPDEFESGGFEDDQATSAASPEELMPDSAMASSKSPFSPR